MCIRSFVCAALAAATAAVAAPVEVPYLELAAPVNPVSRRADALSCLNGYVGSDHWKREAFFDAEGDYCLRVSSETPEVPGWSAFRIGWDAQPLPDGIRLEVRPSRPGPLGLELFSGYRHNAGGFFTAGTVANNLQVDLPEDGWQTLELRWSRLPVSEADRTRINGIGLVFRAPLPYELSIRRNSMLFDDPERARAFAEATVGGFARRQLPMFDALAALGIDPAAIRAESDPYRRETWIWQGLDLAAMRNQIEWFNALNAANAGETHPEWAAENAVLLADFAASPTGFDPARARELQARVDGWIDRSLETIPVEKRRWRLGEDGRFYAPTGAPWRMYAPFFFRGMFDQDSVSSWRKEDLRYLSALGFNGLRLFVSWLELEPERGKLNAHCLERKLAILREAERYGLGASFDLHWPYPEWFHAGASGTLGKHDTANSYHWSEALIDAWRQIGAAFAGAPNLVAFEVPTNETSLAVDPEGLKTYPSLMREWNQWLKAEYGTREALDAVWGAAARHPERYRLQPDESWDDFSILPMGFQGESSPDEAYRDNPRLYDFLRWVAFKQQQVSGGIVAALRENIPDAVGVFQRTIGDMWDSSPVPLNYRAILTSVGRDVLPGTHYGMGGLEARKAAALSMAGYDSEQQMENCFPAVRTHVEIGGGFCPFAFHATGGGGMLFSDNDWHLKPEVVYLVENAEWIKNHWPAPESGPKVALLIDTREEATTGERSGDLGAMLRARGCRVREYEVLRVLDQPALLDDADAVVAPTDFMDTRLVAELARRPRTPILFYGPLDRDAYVCNQSAGLPGALTANGVLLASPEVGTLSGGAGSLDLTGSWEWKFAGQHGNAAPMTPPAAGDVEGWIRKPVPALWGEKGMTGTLDYYLGDVWQRTRFTLPPELRGSNLRLRIGAIDDLDWVWLNGRLIGHTGEETQNYWVAPREYPIPADALNPDGENELVVGIRNLRDDGGIWRGPVELTGDMALSLRFDGADEALPIGVTARAGALGPDQLRPDAEVLAWLQSNDGRSRYPAVIAQDRLFWYVRDTPWECDSAADNRVLDLLFPR